MMARQSSLPRVLPSYALKHFPNGRGDTDQPHQIGGVGHITRAALFFVVPIHAIGRLGGQPEFMAFKPCLLPLRDGRGQNPQPTLFVRFSGSICFGWTAKGRVRKRCKKNALAKLHVLGLSNQRKEQPIKGKSYFYCVSGCLGHRNSHCYTHAYRKILVLSRRFYTATDLRFGLSPFLKSSSA